MRESVELIREWWQQLRLSECPLCGADDIDPSHPRAWDRVLVWLSLRPYRCAACHRRFHLRGVTPKPGAAGAVNE